MGEFSSRNEEEIDVEVEVSPEGLSSFVDEEEDLNALAAEEDEGEEFSLDDDF